MIIIKGTDENQSWLFAPEYSEYTLRMGGGDDAVIDRSASASIVYGGMGNDILQTYAGDDEMHGNRGADSFYVSNTGAANHVELWGGRGHDSVVIESDSDVVGSSGNGHGEEIIGFANGEVVVLHGMDAVFLM